MYGVPIIKNLIMVEIPLTSVANGTIINFPEEPTLRGKKIMITSVESFNSDQLAVSPGGLNVVTPDGETGVVLNLQEEGTNLNKVQLYPASSFNPIKNNGVTKEFIPFKLSVTKCSVQVTDSTNLTVNQAVLLAIWYKYED